HDDFRTLGLQLKDRGLAADGILLDLGLNSAQVDDPGRGISFLNDGPLEMRMDRTRGEPASAWLNRASQAEIENALFEYGDERWARAIA
ncbi:16S rRNA (cytosine(1402)-N(4))-methyltransferase, partial [Enterococcus faecium]